MGHLGPHPDLGGETNPSFGKLGIVDTHIYVHRSHFSGTFCRGKYLFLSQARLHFLGQSLPRSTSGEALLKQQKKSRFFNTLSHTF